FYLVANFNYNQTCYFMVCETYGAGSNPAVSITQRLHAVTLRNVIKAKRITELCDVRRELTPLFDIGVPLRRIRNLGSVLMIKT
ncbi:TPA: hypothetical protein ACQNL4_001457, partial [Streptococcus pyogenes]